MTDTHTVVPQLSSVSSVSFIDSLPANKHALHDIRYRFRVDNIWTVISTNHPELRPNEVSKDISLEPIVTHDLTIKTTIHHTDTVSVMIACSLNPVAVDLKGLVRLSNALTRVEERLLRYIECAPHRAHCHQVQFQIMNPGLLPCGISDRILLMNTRAMNSKLHGKMDKMPCFGYTLKI
jgi:hypothetical protein